MNYSKYLNQANASIPADIAANLEEPGYTTPLHLNEMNRVLSEKTLQKEAGYAELENGTWLVAMYCPLPEVTKEMIDWWFWWHPQEDARYQLWFPGKHYKTGYAAKDKEYFKASPKPAFRENTQYPVERVGKIKVPLSISFVTPEHFGFASASLTDNDIAIVVCGHVGAYGGLIQHTEMAHIFFQRNDGLFMASRFWVGERCKNSFVKRKIANASSARGMAEHCCIEYRNLAHKLPELYRTFYAT